MESVEHHDEAGDLWHGEEGSHHNNPEHASEDDREINFGGNQEQGDDDSHKMSFGPIKCSSIQQETMKEEAEARIVTTSCDTEMPKVNSAPLKVYNRVSRGSKEAKVGKSTSRTQTKNEPDSCSKVEAQDILAVQAQVNSASAMDDLDDLHNRAHGNAGNTKQEGPSCSQQCTAADHPNAETNGNETSNLLLREEGKKTEFEWEMELYEAFERDEQARFSAREQQRDSTQMELKHHVPMLPSEPPNDKKRAPECVLQERQKKQSRHHVEAVDEKSSRNEEDVCFICFDGGDLMLCDRRSCPKAYHLGCIGRDEAFFTKKGAWFCGEPYRPRSRRIIRWHFCAMCTKSANYQCYTCPTAYCGNCVGQAEFCLLRKRRGLCEECLPIVSMIERNETVNNDGVAVDFEDKETYEYLFKDYWLELREKISVTLPDKDKDGNPLLGAVTHGSDTEDVSDHYESDPEFDQNLEASVKEEEENGATIRKIGRRLRTKQKDTTSETQEPKEDTGLQNAADGEPCPRENHERGSFKPQACMIEGWASKELQSFIEHMKEDVTIPLTKFVVHKLLWTYIKQHNLQNPRKMSEINCDTHLRLIFGKDSVGQFEMFKLLNRHFPSKASLVTPAHVPKKVTIIGKDEHITGEESPPAQVISNERATQRPVKMKRKGRKSEEIFERPNCNEYAAITYMNISLIYLRRALLEEILDDADFHNKVVGAFVKIRVPGNCKMDTCYRLVLVTGTGVQNDVYKAGAKMTNLTLSILNLQKKESIAVEMVSNQDFTKEECERLRLNIKCGFIKTLTVGQLEEKALVLREAKVNDWIENERQRLVNLRDRASEKGRKRELRDCVEKLQELNSPGFRTAKLQARPEVTADPHMDPGYESDVSEGNPAADMRGSPAGGPPHSSWDKCSAGGASWAGGWMDDLKFKDTSTSNKPSSSTREDHHRSRRIAGREPYGGRLTEKTSLRPDLKVPVEETKAYQKNEGGKQRSLVREDHDCSIVGGPHSWRGGTGQGANDHWGGEINTISKFSKEQSKVTSGFDQTTAPAWGGMKNAEPVVTHMNPVIPDIVPTVSEIPTVPTEQEKMWHYMDPSGTIQGSFSMEQLRKWKGTGLFPVDLRIWKTGQGRDDGSILLTDALDRTFGSKKVDNSRKKTKSSDGQAQRAGALSHATPQLIIPNNARHPESKCPSVDTQSAHRSGLSGGRQESVKAGEPQIPNLNHVVNVDINAKADQGGHRRGSSRGSLNESPVFAGRLEDPRGSSRARKDVTAEDSNGMGGYGVHKDHGIVRSRQPGWESNRNDPSGVQDGGHSSRAAPTIGYTKEIPCRFHMQGFCRKGKACGYWHN